MKMETKRERTIEVHVEEDDDFLSQVAAIEANVLSISSTKRRKVDPGEAYTAALRGLVSPDNARRGLKVVPARNDGVHASSSCFKCGKSGHWSRDCDAIGAGGYNGNFGSHSSMPEKQCPCGMGPCLVLTANTQKNPGRKFYKCPLRQENGGCGFFEWCDNASGTNGMVGGKENCGSNSSFPDLPCPCGAGFCLILTAKTGKNIGQQFYRCPANQGSTCGFFRWCNEHNVATDHSVNACKVCADMNGTRNDGYGYKEVCTSCFPRNGITKGIGRSRFSHFLRDIQIPGGAPDLMGEKRKQAERDDNNNSGGGDVVFGRQKKAREDTVTEDEVEEFFAILRRIHAAVSYFRKVDGNGVRMTAKEGSRRLREILEGEMSVSVVAVNGVNGGKGKGKRRSDEGVVNAGFDLNADPSPECDPL
ncbi:hypothetical protein FH972_000684 [Carpinus fangiana]|uniref:Uncharacterized protein n=1 Tax=Carpinus fangiana TaxID=176857 RepID=A0A5N6Q9L5_9ROSI|nr:hypothetical protein FH972_000684 [Carpinus fangiana]